MLFALCLTHFLSSIIRLESHPTESNYHLWQRNTEPYGTTQRSYNVGKLSGGSNPDTDGPILPLVTRKNFNQSRIEWNPRDSEFQAPNGGHHQHKWHRSNGRNPHFQFSGTEFQVHARSDVRETIEPTADPTQFITDELEGERSIKATTPCAVQLFNGTHSSHANCETLNQNDERKAMNVGEVGRDHDEKKMTNLEESARDLRRGATATKGIPNAASFTNQTLKGSKRQRPRPSSSKPQSSQIVFPDGYRAQKFVPRVTKCGKKTTFCEHIGEEYPSEYINQVLKREGAMFREFFGKDMISDPNITERIHAPEENSLCPFRQEVVFPRAAKNKDDKWLFVVNQDQYVQGVTVEVCLNPESRCMLTEGFPLGYTPYCKQKYIERRLVAIGEDGKPHSDSFRLPSCCSCVVKHETSSRMETLRMKRNADPSQTPLKN